ncbi:hypothetical protein H0X06_01810 [Candidatus Dependentiae bacterium]|nr:hypothetical protein [Candidatus Dependentiae bacterium]
MNYNRIFIIQALFVTTFVSYTPSIKSVLVNTWVVKLSKDNRCIFLFDIHAKTRDQRDVEQLRIVIKALRDREETTTRPLKILTESTLNQVRLSKRDVLFCLPGEMSCLEVIEDKEFQYTSIENVDIRGLFLAVNYILFINNSDQYNENIFLDYTFHKDSFRWRIGSLSFNDLLVNYQEQQKSALATCKNLLEICDTVQENESIEKLYHSTIDETNRYFAKYSEFLKDQDIETSSSTSIYKEAFNWENPLKENVRIALIECFSPFFDLYAFARIFTLHKQNSSVDIVLIAGASHCWSILPEFGSTLQSEDVYAKTTQLDDFECLPAEVLYNVLQEKTPMEEIPPYKICNLF